MKLYVIAGEPSGDLHGSNLLRALRAHNPMLQFRGMGGDRMADAGLELVRHIRDTNFMGFVEVVRNLPFILRFMRQVKADIRAQRPDALILIDYPGMNLRMAKFAHGLGIPVYYYISPQLWAWKAGRVEQVRRYVRQMYVILPFEVDFYARHGIQAHFVGHPLLDALRQLPSDSPQALAESLGLDPARPVLALLPGSRAQEIQTMLPLMLAAARQHPNLQPVIAGAPNQPAAFYEGILRQAGLGPGQIPMARNQTYDLLRLSHAALVTSGTATLETALLGVPQVVCYRGSRISYWIARRLVRHIRFIALPNLVLDRAIVPELIQGALTPQRLSQEIDRLQQADVRAQYEADYALLREALGGPGASDRLAQGLLADLETLKG